MENHHLYSIFPLKIMIFHIYVSHWGYCYNVSQIPSSRNLPAIHGTDDHPQRMALTLCSAWTMKQWLEPLTTAPFWSPGTVIWSTKIGVKYVLNPFQNLNPYFGGIEIDDVTDLTRFQVVLTPARQVKSRVSHMWIYGRSKPCRSSQTSKQTWWSIAPTFRQRHA